MFVEAEVVGTLFESKQRAAWLRRVLAAAWLGSCKGCGSVKRRVGTEPLPLFLRELPLPYWLLLWVLATMGIATMPAAMFWGVCGMRPLSPSTLPPVVVASTYSAIANMYSSSAMAATAAPPTRAESRVAKAATESGAPDASMWSLSGTAKTWQPTTAPRSLMTRSCSAKAEASTHVLRT